MVGNNPQFGDVISKTYSFGLKKNELTGSPPYPIVEIRTHEKNVYIMFMEVNSDGTKDIRIRWSETYGETFYPPMLIRHVDNNIEISKLEFAGYNEQIIMAAYESAGRADGSRRKYVRLSDKVLHTSVADDPNDVVCINLDIPWDDVFYIVLQFEVIDNKLYKIAKIIRFDDQTNGLSTDSHRW